MPMPGMLPVSLAQITAAQQQAAILSQQDGLLRKASSMPMPGVICQAILVVVPLSVLVLNSGASSHLPSAVDNKCLKDMEVPNTSLASDKVIQ